MYEIMVVVRCLGLFKKLLEQTYSGVGLGWLEGNDKKEESHETVAPATTQ